ncbi:MAG: alpha/beta hydrolase [Verrucomicrobia bacterium]|nr:alpha/beta hydrolase [Verrucomicrobiota bacterium]
MRQAGRLRLHCVEAGPQHGPVTLLLHGFPECWWGWRRQIAPLARAGLRVVAVDQRGYGTSDKPRGVHAYQLDLLAADVIALAEALGVRRFRLAGHDWGGVVAWWAAARFAERVERVAILNAPHPGVLGPYLFRSPMQALRSSYIAFFQLPWLPEVALSARNFRALRTMLRRTSRLAAFRAGDFAIYRQAWSQPGALTAMLNWYRALPRKWRIPERVRVPALVLWGTQDPALESGLAEASLGLCDSGSMRSFDTIGHWLQHEGGNTVTAALTDFLM